MIRGVAIDSQPRWPMLAGFITAQPRRQHNIGVHEGRCLMPHAICAHCGVQIIHHETMVERDGKTYCCANCAAVHEKAETPARR